MKKAVIVVALVVLWLSAANAASQTVFTGGVKGGITFATIPAAETELDAKLSYRVGGLAGGFVAVEFGGMYAFQPEFLYAMKGVTLGYEGFSQKDTIELSYFEVPLLFRISPRTSGKVGFDFFAGPAVSFRLDATFRSEFGDATDGMDLEDQVKGTDVGLVIGGGVHIGKVLIEARWTEGLTDAAEDTSPDEKAMKNRAFSILLGFKFR
jgi:hypothetical protein